MDFAISHGEGAIERVETSIWGFRSNKSPERGEIRRGFEVGGFREGLVEFKVGLAVQVGGFNIAQPLGFRAVEDQKVSRESLILEHLNYVSCEHILPRN